LKRWISIPAVVLLSVLIGSGGMRAAELTVITENYPPLNYVEDDVLKGPAIEIVDAIMKRLKISTPIKVLPWARGYNLVQNKANTLLFSMTRSEKRETMFKWVGPLAEKKIGMFARRGSGIVLKSMDDARKYRVGVQLAGFGMEELQRLGFENLDPSSSPEANLRKLLAGRMDLWYASNATVAGNCRKLKMTDCTVEQLSTTKTTWMYIAFSKGTTDAMVADWQRTYDALYKEDVVKRIFDAAGLTSLYPSAR